MKRLLLLAALPLVAMLIFVSVAGAQKQPTNEAESQKQATRTVLIQDFRFSPAKFAVKKGTKVT